MMLQTYTVYRHPLHNVLTAVTVYLIIGRHVSKTLQIGSTHRRLSFNYRSGYTVLMNRSLLITLQLKYGNISQKFQ
jgi:hypothetical protein